MNGIESHAVVVNQHTADKNQRTDGVACIRNQSSEAFKLQRERRFHPVVNLCSHIHLSVFRSVAHSLNAHHAMTFRHRCATHRLVRRISGILAEFFGDMGFLDDRLSRQRTFVDAQRDGFEQRTVGRHLVSGFKHDDIAHHNVLTRHLCHVAVAHHGHRNIVVHLIQHFEFLVGVQLQCKADDRSQQDGNQNANRLKKGVHALAEPERFIAGNAHRKAQGYEQNFYQRVVEFFKELRPHGSLFRRRQNVQPMLFPTFQDFPIGQTCHVVCFHKLSFSVFRIVS